MQNYFVKPIFLRTLPRIKLTALAFFLVPMTSQCLAQDHWTPITGTRETSLIFVDLTRIERSGKTVRVWWLQNFETPQRMPSGNSYSSGIFQDEVDCRTKRSRGLQVFVYTDVFGKGVAVSTNSEPAGELTTPPPNSIGERVNDVACNAAKSKAEGRKRP